MHGQEPQPDAAAATGRAAKQGHLGEANAEGRATMRTDGGSAIRAGRRCRRAGPDAKAGEGGRTLDIHVGNVTLYH